MNEHEATDYVTTLVSTVPETPAPIGELVEQGRRARRRTHTRRAVGATAATVAVIAAATAAVTMESGDRAAPRPASTVPGPGGAARVVEQWLVTIQTDGFKSACRFMTTDFQQAMPAYACGNPSADTAPPYGPADSRDDAYDVLSQEGDLATVQVTNRGQQGSAATYTVIYDPDVERWFVAGPGGPDDPIDTRKLTESLEWAAEVHSGGTGGLSLYVEDAEALDPHTVRECREALARRAGGPLDPLSCNAIVLMSDGEIPTGRRYSEAELRELAH